MDRKTLLAAYAHLDRFEVAGFVSHFADGGTMTVGNVPPCVGAPAIRAALDSQLSLLDGLQHDVVDSWHVDHGWMLEVSVTHRVRGVASPVVIRGAHVIRTERGLIRDLRVYADLAPCSPPPRAPIPRRRPACRSATSTTARAARSWSSPTGGGWPR